MCKLMVHLSVPCYFKCNHWLSLHLVIAALDDLCETALTKDLHDFVPVCDMVAYLNSEIALKIIKDWISMQFLFTFLFFVIKSVYSVLVDSFEYFQVVCLPWGNLTSKVNSLYLLITQLFYLFLQHYFAVKTYKVFGFHRVCEIDVQNFYFFWVFHIVLLFSSVFSSSWCFIFYLNLVN